MGNVYKDREIDMDKNFGGTSAFLISNKVGVYLIACLFNGNLIVPKRKQEFYNIFLPKWNLKCEKWQDFMIKERKTDILPSLDDT